MHLRGRVVDLVEAERRHEPVDRELPVAPQVDQVRDELGDDALALDEPADRAAIGQELVDVELDHRAEGRCADDPADPRRAEDPDRLTQRVGTARALERIGHPARGDLAHRLDDVACACVDRVRRSELGGERQARLVEVDDDDRLALRDLRPHDRRQADAAGAEDRDRRSRRRRERVEDRAGARLDAAAERGDELERDVVGDPRDAELVADRLRREARLPEERRVQRARRGGSASSSRRLSGRGSSARRTRGSGTAGCRCTSRNGRSSRSSSRRGRRPSPASRRRRSRSPYPPPRGRGRPAVASGTAPPARRDRCGRYPTRRFRRGPRRRAARRAGPLGGRTGRWRSRRQRR